MLSAKALRGSYLSVSHSLIAAVIYRLLRCLFVQLRMQTRTALSRKAVLCALTTDTNLFFLWRARLGYVASPYVDSTLSASVVAGVVCASFALVLAILSFVLWRKYFQAAYYYLDDPPSQARGSSPQMSETYDDSEYSSVPVTLWSKHVQDLHADGDIGFSREYEAIQSCTDMDMLCEHSQMADNKNKNRYVNIVAYDHSRVILKALPGQKKNSCNDYINGNFIDVSRLESALLHFPLLTIAFRVTPSRELISEHKDHCLPLSTTTGE